jgi:putative drug exporter of the RND superfamily
MSKTKTTVAVARWSAQHPWRALLVWTLFIAAAVAAGNAMATKQASDADYRVGESGHSDQIITDAGLASADSENVLIAAKSGQLDRDSRAEATQVADRIGRQMSDVSIVADVGRPVWSTNRDALLLPITLARDGDATEDADVDVAPLQRITHDAAKANPTLSIAEAGDNSVNDAVNTRVNDDLAKAEGLSLPITLVIMLIAFGALIAAGIPVLLAISGVIATISLYAPLSYLVPATDTVSSMVLLIGMAVGVDYSLFYLKREREERERGRTTLDAVEIAAQTSGHSIVVSGLAVIVAMAGMYVTGDPTFASLATGAILVVAVSVLASLTVLPALLARLGRWVDRPRVPLLWRVNRRIGRGGISRRLLAPVTRYPKTAVLASTAIVVGLALPALGMHLHEGNLQTLPQDIPQVRTAERIQQEFPSQGLTVQVAATTDESTQATTVRALRRIESAAERTAAFRPAGADAVVTAGDGSAAVLTLTTRYVEGDARNDAALASIRTIAPQQLDGVDRSSWAIGGDVAESADYAQSQRDALPWVIGLVLGLTLLMIGITFRSVVLALVTTVLNLLSVGAAFGVLTLVFQHRWAEGLLGFHSSGFVVDWIPLFMFTVLVGLSMDYHVFVLSRIREGVARGLPPRLAVEAGVSETAGVVTSAATVMVSVFAVFATLSLLEMKQMGVGLAVAVLLDATLVRVVMLPSLLVLLGRAAWWPAPMRRPELEPVREPRPELQVTR